MQDSHPIIEQQSSFKAGQVDTATSLQIPLLFLFILLSVVMIRCAWVSDDAYISFRTIDNLVNGYGLRWNVDERVQAFTNPLWVILISAIYAITREMYYTSIFVSIVLSLGAVFCVVRKVSASFSGSMIAVASLLMSRAFIDYSTSGLEQPLLYILAALFIWRCTRFNGSAEQFGWLCLIASLSAVTRLDTVLIYLPPLLIASSAIPIRQIVKKGVFGFAPLIIWEVFSIIYYGFPFPNTYYAKLHAGLPRMEVYHQGAVYFLDSVASDPITLMLVVTALAVAFVTKVKSGRPLAVGVILYLAYTVSVGGDFMSGRFFALPMFVSAAVLSRFVWKTESTLAALAIVGIVGFSAPYPNLLSGETFGTKGNSAIKPNGIADERGWYYQSTGLLRSLHSTEMPAHEWAEKGKTYRLSGTKVAYESCVGFCGFFAGPEVHMYDGYALSEPLLARLPTNPGAIWRIGHLSRTAPFGYAKTLASDTNNIADSGAYHYYDTLCLITKAPLFSRERFGCIVRMNLGDYDHLLKNYWDTTALAVSYDVFDSVKAEGTGWDAKGNLIMRRGGVVISLDTVRKMPCAEFSSDHNDAYALKFYRDTIFLGRVDVAKRVTPAGGLRHETVDIPARANTTGYNRVHIFPVAGDDAYSIGHFRLLEKQPKS